MPYIWTGIIIFSAAAGVSAASRAAFRLIPAGFAAFILSLSGAQVWQQALLFFILAPVLLVFFRTFSRKSAGFKNPAAGSSAIVTQEINNRKETGEIRINGLAHTARAEEDDVIYETGLVVTVVRLEGGQAVCTR